MQTSKTMSPEARAARAAYQRKWRREHPDKMREYLNNTWERKYREMVEDGLISEDGTIREDNGDERE